MQSQLAQTKGFMRKKRKIYMPRNPNWMQLLTLRSSGAMGHHGDEKKYNRKKKHKKKKDDNDES